MFVDRRLQHHPSRSILPGRYLRPSCFGESRRHHPCPQDHHPGSHPRRHPASNRSPRVHPRHHRFHRPNHYRALHLLRRALRRQAHPLLQHHLGLLHRRHRSPGEIHHRKPHRWRHRRAQRRPRRRQPSPYPCYRHPYSLWTVRAYRGHYICNWRVSHRAVTCEPHRGFQGKCWTDRDRGCWCRSCGIGGVFGCGLGFVGLVGKKFHVF